MTLTTSRIVQPHSSRTERLTSTDQTQLALVA
jgi:hypothetical protein